MLVRLALTLGLVIGAVGTMSHMAAAAPLAPQINAAGQAAGEFTPIPVQFGRCRAWRRECADRWGWQTPRYFRCMIRHGC